MKKKLLILNYIFMRLILNHRNLTFRDIFGTEKIFCFKLKKKMRNHYNVKIYQFKLRGKNRVPRGEEKKFETWKQKVVNL